MRKPYIFSVECDMFENDFVVAVDATKEDVLKWLKEIEAKKEWIEKVEHSDDAFTLLAEGATACYWYDDRAKMILLKSYVDTWEYWETLMHECTHAMQWMGKTRRMQNEDEALAYFQEWLFRTIRKKLQSMPTLKNKRTGRTVKLAKKPRPKPRRVNKRKVA